MQKYSFFYEKIKEWKDPESVFIDLFGEDKHAFWLDSSKVIDGFSRFSYMGKADKVIRYDLSSNQKDIFTFLEENLRQVQIPKTSLPFDFTGGYVGYFGYELKELCGFSNSFISEYPDSIWYFVDTFLVFDNKEHTIYIACLAKNKIVADKWINEIKFVLKKESLKINTAKKRENFSEIHLKLKRSEKQYLQDINACKKYLKNGESYEICLTNRLYGSIDKDPLDIYRSLRKVNPAPYSAYFHDEDFTILCSSPERFLKIDQNRWIESKPMKGTVARSLDEKEDLRLKKQLQTNEKDRAENLMIVDLVRNDLGKVCEVGSVKVSQLMHVETYQTVHQMISTVKGKVKDTVSSIACIKACFPGGSMTGAPKKRTIEIIDSLEKNARGVYSGALGFLSSNGAVDLNIVIRTMVINKKKVSIGVGGAILYQSNSQNEVDEMLLKSQALKTALIQSE